MFVINAYDAAKLLAGIVILGVVVAFVILPFQIVGDFIFSLGHLGDNGYGPVWVLPAALVAVAGFFAFKRRWRPVIASGAALLVLGGLIMWASHGMRGDAVAYGSDRNEQWAEALGGVRQSALAWLLPKSLDSFVRDADVDCCLNKHDIEDNGDYPVVKTNWRPVFPGKEREGPSVFVGKYILHPHTFLHDYMEIANEAGGDWLGYFSQCHVKVPADIEEIEHKYGDQYARRVAHEAAMRAYKRPEGCKNVEGVRETFGIDLRAEAAGALDVEDEEDIAEACAADEGCRRFERDFAISL